MGRVPFVSRISFAGLQRRLCSHRRLSKNSLERDSCRRPKRTQAASKDYMPPRRKGERVLGPYENRGGWVLFLVATNGARTLKRFTTKKEALAVKRDIAELIVTVEHTTESATESYEQFLVQKGNKPRSRYCTLNAIKRFFPQPVPLWGLTETKCKARYQELCSALAVDTHRNTLAETKTFFRWCVEERLISKSPLENVKGIGKRKRRKTQLRLKDARKWYRKALELAAEGDAGAVAALCALLLAMRASEVVSRTVYDVDEDRELGDLLWIPDSKTDAGRRTLEVPSSLQPHLAALCEGKKADELIFGKHWRDWPRHQVKRICRLVDVPEVTAHGMRGALATFGLRQGAPARMVADFLGHESDRTTREHYAEPDSMESASRRRGWEVLEGGKQKK